MSTRFTAKGICELALEKIGATSVNDAAADGLELDRTLKWFDLVMADLAGRERIFWLVPATVQIPLTGGTSTYDIESVLGTAAPETGIQFPIKAMLNDGSNNLLPLAILTREEYEAIEDPAQSGTPESIWLDRLDNPTMITWPVLGSGVTGYTVDLVVQTYAKAFAGTKGEVATGLRAAWQLWAAVATAAQIGAGPIRRLPRTEINDMREDAKNLERALLAFENRQHATTSGRLKARDF